MGEMSSCSKKKQKPGKTQAGWRKASLCLSASGEGQIGGLRIPGLALRHEVGGNEAAITEKSNQPGYVGGLWVSESLGETWACNSGDPQRGRAYLREWASPQPAAMVLTVGTSNEMERLFTYGGIQYVRVRG